MSTTFNRYAYQASGNETLYSVNLLPALDFTHSATDYWTFQAWVQATSEEYGQFIADEVSLATYDLEAGTPLTLFNSQTGYPLASGDKVKIVVILNGSPVSLGDIRISVTILHRTR